MTPEMRQARLGKLTGSRAGVVMGKLETDQLRDYVQELAFERVFGDPDEDGVRTKAMDRGNELEPRALEWYEFATDCLLLPKDEATGGVIQHPVFPFVSATPDGMRADPKICVEAKCLLRKGWMYAEEARKVPSVYLWQVRWEQWVTGAEVCHFVVWHPKSSGFVIENRVTADEIEQMAKRATMVNVLVERRVAQLRANREVRHAA